MGAKISERIIDIGFLIVGIGLIILGGFNSISTADFKKRAAQTTATVVSVDKHKDAEGEIDYKITLTYTVDGKTYNDIYTSSTYEPEGTITTVYYDRNNPENMKLSTSSVGGIIIAIFGIPFGLIGGIRIRNRINRKKEKNTLLSDGDKIYANFEDITMNYSYSVNNKHPYIIICTGKDNATGEKRTFKSENIWKNPENIIRVRNITTFPVYIDKNNREKYYVSLEELEGY